MSIKPIETIYNGYRFRSRLEARWAVFFDAAGIKYQYEQEGFCVSDFDRQSLYYLPDFYFPDQGIYGEVKGRLFTEQEKEKMAWCIDYCGPLKDGLVLFGNIPSKLELDDMPDFNIPFVYWDKGIVKSFACFVLNGPRKLRFLLSDFQEFITSAPDFPYDAAEPFFFFPYGDDVDEWLPHKALVDSCINKARQARFEHGECV